MHKSTRDHMWVFLCVCTFAPVSMYHMSWYIKAINLSLPAARLYIGRHFQQVNSDLRAFRSVMRAYVFYKHCIAVFCIICDCM
jgi:hypothetical protein